MSLSGISADVLIEGAVTIPMGDGARLVADVYRPSDAGRHPVLVHRTPYGRRNLTSSFIALNPVDLARAGFVVVVQDTRGRGQSDGDVFHPFAEGQDGYDTIQWAAEQDWSNGRVGGFGSSYMAATQLQAAALAPPALITMCPAQGSCDYFEGRTYWGGAFEFGALVTTSLTAMLPASFERLAPDAATARALRHDAARVLDTLGDLPVPFPLIEHLGGPDGALAQLTPWFFDWVTHDHRDEFWRELSLAGRHHAMRSTALHLTSWFDQFHVGTLSNFRALREHPDPSVADGQYLIIGPWHHFAMPGHSLGVTRVGDRYFGAAAALNLAAIQQSWLADQLTGTQTFRQTSRVRYFLMGRNEWRGCPDWPPPGTTVRPLYLSRNGQEGILLDEPSAQDGRDGYIYEPTNPVPTTGGAHLVHLPLVSAGAVYQDAIVTRPDVLSYAGPLLESEVIVVGSIRAFLHVTSDAPTTDFTCRLADVEPGGRMLGVCDGIARVTLGGKAIVEISLGSTAYAFAPGHRIALLVSSSNYPRFDPNPGTGESAFFCRVPRTAQQAVRWGGDCPSRIELPVITRSEP